MSSLQDKANTAASPLLILFAFALPLSTSAGSILAVLIFLCWILSGNKAAQFRMIKQNPVAVAVLCYILLHIVGLLWSDDLVRGLEVFKKQWKLILLPVFLTLTQRKHIKYYLAAFVTAIFLKACKVYLVWLNIISLEPSSIFTTEGTSHVLYNPMLALACYIVLQHLLSKKTKAAATCMLAALFLFLSCNMFITAGRTGQVAYCALMTVALFQYFYHRSKKMLLASLLCIPLLIVGIYQSGTIFKDRIDTAVLETENYTSGEVTSVGCRIWFCKNTITMIKQNWLIGTGTGDFSLDYAKINHKYSPTMPDTDNPHNQYLLTLSQFGLLGLLSLAAIFYSQFMLAFKMKDALSPLRLAFPIFFLVIMLAESYLQVYGTGFLFSLFSAFLYKDFSKQSIT